MAKACILAALLAVACTTTVSSALSTATNNQTGTWIDLFQPPYNSGPSIMMGLSCNTRWSCYVPGGSNGAGFEMFKFPGVANGAFIQLKMPNPPLMMMTIALGGPADAPGGAVAGIGIGNGVQYPVDNMTFMPSKTPELLAPSQDARASIDGQDVLVINAGPNDVLYSSNGGKDFGLKTINVKLAANCTLSRYGAMVDKNTWYVSMGSWPNSNSKNTDSHFHLSRRVSVSRCPKTGKVARHSRKFLKATETGSSGSSSSAASSSSNSEYSIYTAQIVKTTDGGNTWTTQFSQASNFYFNAIDCLSATHCVAVGEGMDANPGVHIYRTIDGVNWHQVLFKPSISGKQMFSLMSLRANEHGHLFAAGGYETQTGAGSYILTSVDGGATWVEENSLPNAVEITDLSFTPGGYGFATAETIYQTSTILRYDPTHPGPTPPQPPTPTQAMFIQEQCSDSACTVDCRNISFVSGGCIPVSGGGSAIVTCGKTTLNQESFDEPNCEGVSKNSTMPLNQCLESESGGFFENICGVTSGMMLGREQLHGKHAPKLRITRA